MKKVNSKNQRKSRKVKINYFKMIRSIIILVILIYTLVLGIQNAIAKNERNNIEVNYTTYHVSKGETLWSIAEQQDYDGDIREVVYKIRQDNNIDGNLSIGQEIQLRNIY